MSTFLIKIARSRSRGMKKSQQFSVDEIDVMMEKRRYIQIRFCSEQLRGGYKAVSAQY